jgi:hypothetical protein
MSLEFSGLILPFHHHHLLVYGPEAEALGAPLYGPPVYLSPGYRFFEQNQYLLPSEVIDDLGQRFTAPECYEWIEKRGDAFPRADLIGFTPSGEKKTVFMKEMDLAEMRVFASGISMETDWPGGGSVVRLDLAIEALAQPDGYALTPTNLPLGLLSRALPCYRLAPGVFGAIGAALISQLLTTGRRDWRLTFDDLDEMRTEDG